MEQRANMGMPAPPICAGVAMVRNEADILELWARYNLRVLDSLHVINHLSQDNTTDILDQLRGEGLPVFAYTVLEPEFAQAEFMRNLARHLAAQKVADFFIPLDADELICTDKNGLHSALNAIPDGHIGRMNWRSYLPQTGDEPDFFRRMHRYRRHEPPLGKVIAPAHLMATHAWVMGNHKLCDEGTNLYCPEMTLPFPLAHFPVRNLAQLRKKVTTAALALRLKKYRVRGQGLHILALDDELRRGAILNRDIDLQDIALRYGHIMGAQTADDASHLDGPIPDDPNIQRRYAIHEVTLPQVLAQSAQIAQANTYHLEQVGYPALKAANQAFGQNRITDALELYTEASYLNPALMAAHHGRARCLSMGGQTELAQEVMFCALHDQPDDVTGWIILGQLRHDMGQSVAATHAFARALELQPNHPAALAGITAAKSDPPNDRAPCND